MSIKELELDVINRIDNDLESDRDLDTLMVLRNASNDITIDELNKLVDEYIDIKNHGRVKHGRRSHYRNDGKTFVSACKVSASNVNKRKNFITNLDKKV